MKILFISTSCSNKKYKEVCKLRNQKLIDPQQKFCNLFIEGLSNIEGIEIDCLSAIPVSASTTSQKIFFEENEEIKRNLRYKYLPFKNGKITRYVSLYLNSKKEVNKWIQNNPEEEKIIICDALTYFITRSAQKIAKKERIKIIGILTDLPLLSTNMKKRKESFIKKIGLKIFQYLTDYSLREYDAYIPLTESLNKAVNTLSKPYVIIEGFADSQDLTTEKEHQNYIMYAGGVYEKYGLKTLVDAFIKLKRKDIDLYIFGEGSFVNEIIKLSKHHNNIYYKGCVSTEEIVKYEKKALLLVNPRPVNEEFSKYSFPSKTIEYMLSGTPVISTKLPGIPEEYFDYIYSFESDSVEGIKKTLEKILLLDKIELINKGIEAHNYVINNKNNIIMAKKVISFLEENTND